MLESSPTKKDRTFYGYLTLPGTVQNVLEMRYALYNLYMLKVVNNTTRYKKNVYSRY